MKERPILFSAPMVRAILAGQKTQTRRIVKLPPGCGVGTYTTDGEALPHEYVIAEPDGDPGPPLRCPFAAGMNLWVKETHCFGGSDSFGPIYRASGATLPAGAKWRPSIFMPRWASRINLRVTDIRAERLHDITEAGARVEGCRGSVATFGRAWDEYRDLWEEINGVGAWKLNPWVWVVSFEVRR